MLTNIGMFTLILGVQVVSVYSFIGAIPQSIAYGHMLYLFIRNIE